jgi:hypothetical protein
MVQLMPILLAENELKRITWSFFATAHGKGVVDGIGGTLKRNAWLKVKARQCIISNANEFHAAVVSSSIETVLLSSDEIAAKFAEVQERLLSAPSVPRIQKDHFWSLDAGHTVHRATVSKQMPLPVAEPEPVAAEPEKEHYTVGNYVAIQYNDRLYPGKVTEVKQTTTGNVQYLVNVMHPSSGMYVWPKRKDWYYYSEGSVVRKISEPIPAAKRRHFTFVGM